MINRKLPNILVTGTPGVGKSTLCEQLIAEYGSASTCPSSQLRWLNVGRFAREHQCLIDDDDQDNDEYNCPVLDEDKLLDEMESVMDIGGAVVDYHGSDFFPQRWFNVVFVLRTNNTRLYDRLHTQRGYTGRKLDDNLQCEIFQTLLDEALAAYEPSIVHELTSNTPDDMTRNVDAICRWIHCWTTQHV